METLMLFSDSCKITTTLLLTILGCARCLPLEDDSVCTAEELATYSIIFTGKWSQLAFPKQYPLYRPPAQWSPLLGVVHSSDYNMWKITEFASNGMRDFAERGETWTLMKEIEAAGEKIQSVHGIFSAPAISSGTGQTSTDFEVHSRHPLVSFAVRIVPSPDWFVGIDSLNLCEKDHWMEQISVELSPYDAGTDSGFTFSSPNFATIPQEPVTEKPYGASRSRVQLDSTKSLEFSGLRILFWTAQGSKVYFGKLEPQSNGESFSLKFYTLEMEITCSSPSHPANSFYYPKLKNLPPIARVTMIKLNRSKLGFPLPPPNVSAIDNEIEDTISETPLDCETSLWSSWGLCRGTCGHLGTKTRTRYIHLHPANNGTPCPNLNEETDCEPDNCV